MFLCYASTKGAAFIDRALYLPKEWAKDAECRAEAGVPEEVGFATKPELARRMLESAGRQRARGVGDGRHHLWVGPQAQDVS